MKQKEIKKDCYTCGWGTFILGHRKRGVCKCNTKCVNNDQWKPKQPPRDDSRKDSEN